MINNQTNRQLDKQTLLLYIYKYDYSKLVALDETHNMYGFKTNISECPVKMVYYYPPQIPVFWSGPSNISNYGHKLKSTDRTCAWSRKLCRKLGIWRSTKYDKVQNEIKVNRLKEQRTKDKLTKIIKDHGTKDSEPKNNSPKDTWSKDNWSNDNWPKNNLPKDNGSKDNWPKDNWPKNNETKDNGQENKCRGPV